jgi:hypothetical protein
MLPRLADRVPSRSHSPRGPDQSRPAGCALLAKRCLLAERMRPARALKPGMGLICHVARRYRSPSPPVLPAATTKSTCRLPHLEQTSRLRQTSRSRSAPCRFACSAGSRLAMRRQLLHQTCSRRCALAVVPSVADFASLALHYPAGRAGPRACSLPSIVSTAVPRSIWARPLQRLRCRPCPLFEFPAVY